MAKAKTSHESNTTTNHEEIKKWVEERGGSPAIVKGTEKGDSALLRIDYPGYSGEDTLETIGWDEFFEIFDETVHKYRKFFVLPYSNASNYKSPVFFELLEEGEITLLSRDLLEYKTYNSGLYGGSYTLLTETHNYFLLKSDGTIVDFKGTRNDLLSLMGTKGKMVEKYIRTNRLDFDDKYDVAQMVAYYNSLAGT